MNMFGGLTAQSQSAQRLWTSGSKAGVASDYVDYEDTYGVGNPTERAHITRVVDAKLNLFEAHRRQHAGFAPNVAHAIDAAAWNVFIYSLLLKPSE